MPDALCALMLMVPLGAATVSYTGHFGGLPGLEAEDSFSLPRLQPI